MISISCEVSVNSATPTIIVEVSPNKRRSSSPGAHLARDFPANSLHMFQRCTIASRANSRPAAVNSRDSPTGSSSLLAVARETTFSAKGFSQARWS